MAFAQDNDPESPIALEVSRTGGTAAVLLRATGEDVFLPACRGVVWEQFIQPEDGEEGGYVPITDEACGPSKLPIKVSKDGVSFDAPALDEVGSGVLRAVVMVGLGCAPDRPLAVGECTTLHSEISSNITIAAVEDD